MTLLTSLAGYLALIIQFYIVLERKISEGHSVLYGTNHYLSYFTVLTNLSLATFLFSSYVWPDSKLAKWFKKSHINGAMLLYILIVGIVFYVLLLSKSKAQGLELYATHILHGFMPCMYLLIWYKYYRKSDLQFKYCLQWLKAPFFYLVYVLVRGQLIGVYPYFFLDVNKSGYGQVALFSFLILCFFVLLSVILVWVDRIFTF